ncbi:MAG: MiaB/RimO family radical SAM methylthiotransferase [Microgenomates group bacterium]
MKYYLSVFGCAANTAESERIAASYVGRGWSAAETIVEADEVVIVTCMIRQSAEDRVTGLLRNLGIEKTAGRKVKIIVTGCMTGLAIRDTSGKIMAGYKKKYPMVDEFLAIEEVGFASVQLRSDPKHALVLISNGCNNFCSYCVVPFARGREVSRPMEEIIKECEQLAHDGVTIITLVGQNVNSYGADLVKKKKILDKNGNGIKPVYVKHLGKMRIPTLFPHLLTEVAAISGLQSIDFISSNPWDFSDELIEVIASNKNIKRLIHLPVQSGDTTVLKRMNRWYTPAGYIRLVNKMRKKIPDVQFSTDIIVGFPDETVKQFEHTIKLCETVGFAKAYISIYSDRPSTFAHNTLGDTIPYAEKKRRWEVLDELINKTNLRKGTYPLYE